MQKVVFATFVVIALGCDDRSRIEQSNDERSQPQDEVATLIDDELGFAVDELSERLASIEASLEQMQSKVDLVIEELKAAQLQQDRLAAFEAEIKQALVDLGNVVRRAIPSQNVRQPDAKRDR